MWCCKGCHRGINSENSFRVKWTYTVSKHLPRLVPILWTLLITLKQHFKNDHHCFYQPFSWRPRYVMALLLSLCFVFSGCSYWLDENNHLLPSFEEYVWPCSFYITHLWSPTPTPNSAPAPWLGRLHFVADGNNELFPFQITAVFVGAFFKCWQL